MEGSRTITVAEEEQIIIELKDELQTDRIAQNAREALLDELGKNNFIWDAVIQVLNWLQEGAVTYLARNLQTLPIISNYSDRIATTVTGLVFTVLRLVVRGVKVLLSSSKFWQMAHASAIQVWKENEQNGIVVQGYAYAKRMAGFLIEALKQILERVIVDNGLQVNESDKQEITTFLDKLKF